MATRKKTTRTKTQKKKPIRKVASKKERNNLAGQLDIQKTPDPKRGRRPRYRGVKTNYTMEEFWAGLFELNERLPKDKRMTDAEIARQVAEEFPQSKQAQSIAEGRASNKVSWFRGRYNRGAMTDDKVPSVLSKRYDIDGNVMIVGPKNAKEKKHANTRRRSR